LAAGNGEGLLEAGFGRDRIRDGLAQQQGALQRYASARRSP
jgi:hypothetical protein